MRCQEVARRCNFQGVFSVDAIGKSGGLCLLWHDELEVNILTYSQNLIHISIDHAVLPSKWILSCVYGPPHSNQKKFFWNQLETMVNSINEPWAMIGDLNEILSSDEKLGGRSIGSMSNNYLNDFLQNTGSIDLGFSGNSYTWRNNRIGLSHIRQRLDRVIANDKWRITFPRAGVMHLPAVNSDHNPIWLKLWMDSTKRPYPFRFECAWIRDHSCSTTIKQAWVKQFKGSAPFRFCKKLKNTKASLKIWNKTQFKNCDTKIQDIFQAIDEIQKDKPSKENKLLELKLQKELNETLIRKDMIWKQKSRELWLKDGDKNSIFSSFNDN